MEYEVKINNKRYLSLEKNVTGVQILTLGGFVPVEDFDLYKRIQGREYEPIQLDEKVDLEEPGIEFFKVIPRIELIFEIDDENFTTKEFEMTPLEILRIVNCNPEEFYLKQLTKHMEITYKEDMNKSIEMINHPIFITCKLGPTTVS